MDQQEKTRVHNRAFCASAVVWLLLASVLPLAELWAVVLTLVAMGATYLLVKGRALK